MYTQTYTHSYTHTRTYTRTRTYTHARTQNLDMRSIDNKYKKQNERGV